MRRENSLYLHRFAPPTRNAGARRAVGPSRSPCSTNCKDVPTLPPECCNPLRHSLRSEASQFAAHYGGDTAPLRLWMPSRPIAKAPMQRAGSFQKYSERNVCAAPHPKSSALCFLLPPRLPSCKHRGLPRSPPSPSFGTIPFYYSCTKVRTKSTRNALRFTKIFYIKIAEFFPEFASKEYRNRHRLQNERILFFSLLCILRF